MPQTGTSAKVNRIAKLLECLSMVIPLASKELTNVRLKAIEANICVREHDQAGSMLSIFIWGRTGIGSGSGSSGKSAK